MLCASSKRLLWTIRVIVIVFGQTFVPLHVFFFLLSGLISSLYTSATKQIIFDFYLLSNPHEDKKADGYSLKTHPCHWVQCVVARCHEIALVLTHLNGVQPVVDGDEYWVVHFLPRRLWRLWETENKVASNQVLPSVRIFFQLKMFSVPLLHVGLNASWILLSRKASIIGFNETTAPT